MDVDRTLYARLRCFASGEERKDKGNMLKERNVAIVNPPTHMGCLLPALLLLSL